MTETEGKCEHGRNLVRTYCPCFILRITMDKLLASQKSALLAKVMEILNSGDNTWACDCNDAGEIVGVIGLEWLKKRIAEELK